MFSSNQRFQISGDMRQLKDALQFALRYSDSEHTKIVFQIAKDGKYCIGWSGDTIPSGWQKYQFDFDIEIVSKIIAQHLSKQPKVESGYEWADGSTDDGFLMKNIGETFGDKDGVKNAFYGIVSFEPYCNFYSK